MKNDEETAKSKCTICTKEIGQKGYIYVREYNKHICEPCTELIKWFFELDFEQKKEQEEYDDETE
jgi:hypothetical protein